MLVPKTTEAELLDLDRRVSHLRVIRGQLRQQDFPDEFNAEKLLPSAQHARKE